MEDTLAKAGIEVNEENKEEIDKAIHSIVGVDYKNCSVAWKEAKEMIAEDEESFIEKLNQIVD